MVLPGSVGIDGPAVRDELTRYLLEGWTPVIEGDVDGPNSGPFRVDRRLPRCGERARQAGCRPGAARAEQASATKAADKGGPSAAGAGTGSGTAPAGTDKPPVVEPRLPRRFFGTVRLDPIRAGRDMSVVTDEVVKHLTALPGAAVEVSVEISATVEDGVSASVQRIVNENCKALRFRSNDFEEE